MICLLSKVQLPFTYAWHMDPACPKCLLTRMANLRLKGTYQEHSCAHTPSTLNSVDVRQRRPSMLA